VALSDDAGPNAAMDLYVRHADRAREDVSLTARAEKSGRCEAARKR
jgi:hypothetical protein